MQAKRLILEFKETPNPGELDILLLIAQKLKAVIIQDPRIETTNTSNTKGWRPLSLNIFQKLPSNLNRLAIKESDLASLVELFSDEDLSAEEMAKMID